MINYIKGDLLKAETEAIINTVNTVGVMGKGIALQFKKQFPENFNYYKKACNDQSFHIGDLIITPTNLFTTKYIINFPTKIHWRDPSKYEYIEKGLETLVKKIIELQIKSISIPPLGSGNGKLEWEKVKMIIEKYLSPLKNVDIHIYEPQADFAERDSTRCLKQFFLSLNIQLIEQKKSVVLILPTINQ